MEYERVCPEKYSPKFMEAVCKQVAAFYERWEKAAKIHSGVLEEKIEEDN